MSREIDYGSLMHRALRGLIHEVLSDVAERGLPGAHHFFITFDTRHGGVRMAQWLKDRYPEEMTIVLQHWFDGLHTGPDGFEVTLNFGDSPETLTIPYDSIRTFVDPSVEFGLRFETHPAGQDEESDQAGDDDRGDAARDARRDPRADTHKDAEIVSLDSWRK